MSVQKPGDQPTINQQPASETEGDPSTQTTQTTQTTPTTQTPSTTPPGETPPPALAETTPDGFTPKLTDPLQVTTDASSTTDSLSGAFTLGLTPTLTPTLGLSPSLMPGLMPGLTPSLTTGLTPGFGLGSGFGPNFNLTVTQATRVDAEAFAAANRDNPIMSRPIITNADHYAPAEGQNWTALARELYGPQLGLGATEETIALLAEGLAQINGRSNLEAPPKMIAVPDLRDVNRFLVGMKRDLHDGPPIIRAAVAQFGGAEATPRNLPTAGHSYQARWNDTLRGVAIHAYSGELQGLSPEEADAKLQKIMMMLARINELNTTDLRDAGVIWMPSPRQLGHAMRALDNPMRFQSFQRRNAGLWQSIERTGVDALTDIAYNEVRDIKPATSRAELAEVIDQTDSAVRLARFDRAMDGPMGMNFWGIFSWNWLFEFYTEEPPEGDELPIRRENETFKDYLDRVAPDLPPEEYLRVLENPGSFMMRAAGMINANGDIDPQKQQEFTAAMQTLGLVDESGAWLTADPEPGETAQGYADRVSIEAARRAGIKFEVQEGDTLETIYARIKETASPQELALARQLVIWNQLVVLGVEAPGGEDGDNPMLGPDPEDIDFNDLFGDDMFDLFLYGGYMPPPIDVASPNKNDMHEMMYGWDDPEFIDPGAPEYATMIEEEDSLITDELAAEMEKAAAKANAQRTTATNAAPSDEEVIATKRANKSTDKVIEQDRRHVRQVVEERVDENVEVNQAQDKGERVGGSGRRRRGS